MNCELRIANCRSDSRFVFFVALLICILFYACGEVDGGSGGEPKPPKSSSSVSSSSSASSSSFAGVSINWIKAPAASYVHGSTNITLDAFMISYDLITQEQYKTVMGVNPSMGKIGDDLPVDGVTWFKAVEFCKKLSLLFGLDSSAITLPTEAQWEYAGYADVFNRNYAYWEWTNDCYDTEFPYTTNNPSGPPNCLANDPKVRKGFNGAYDVRYSLAPNFEDAGTIGDLSFRVAVKNKDYFDTW